MAETLTTPQIDPLSGNVVHPAATIPNFTADLNNVFSTSNIQQATTNPTAAPDDLLNIRNSIYNELGIPKLQQQYQDIYKNVLGFDLGTTAQQQGIEGQPVAMNVIRGEQAQAANQRALQRQGMVAQADVAQSALQAALGEAQTQFGIRAQEVEQKRSLILQYPGAGITFGDSLQTAASKLDNYQKQAEKDIYKKELKKMAMSLGVKTSGSTKDLEKRISKENKKAKQMAQQEAELKLEALRWDIANTKSTIANRGGGGSGSEDKEIASFKADAIRLQNQMAAENSPMKWADAFNYMKTYYPNASVDLIDQTLGYGYRSQFDK